MWGVSAEIQDTPDFFARTREIPVPPSQEPRTVIEFVPNPDQYLWKMTLTLSPSQLFLLPSDLETTYGAILKNRKLFNTTYDPLSLEDREIDYFARRRSVDRSGRILSGLTLTVAVSERPRLESGRPLPSPVFSEDERVETYGVKFDPLPLFETGSERASAYAALGSYARAYKRKDVIDRMTPLCKGQYDVKCLEEIAGFKGVKRWVAALFPMLEYKSIDQFDFTNIGGRFIFVPFFDETIETYTATWDLKRAFKLSKERLGAISAIQASQELSAPKPEIEVGTNSKNIVVGELIYVKFRVKGGLKDLAWSVKKSTCPDVAESGAFKGVSLEGEGLLAGYPEKHIPACTFVVSVTDAVGREAQAVCDVSPVTE